MSPGLGAGEVMFPEIKAKVFGNLVFGKNRKGKELEEQAIL